MLWTGYRLKKCIVVFYAKKFLNMQLTSMKKIINKKFREANVVWNIVLYLEDIISNLEEEVNDEE